MSEASLSRRPYLIRAIYDWVLDCGYTPLLLVAAAEPGVRVPQQFIDDEGRIVLNIGPDAIQALELGNEEISFRARFGGKPELISVPPGSVVAVYARETGDGMLLGDPEVADDTQPPRPDSPPGDPDDKARKRAHLKVVK